jgi:hypothetical protein
MIHFAPEPSGRAAFDAFLRRLLAADWGDLVARRNTSEWPGIADDDHIRVTILWRRFLSFVGTAQAQTPPKRTSHV